MALKDWEKVEEGEEQKMFSKGIYGINGNYIWENKEGDILYLQKVVGGGTAITLHKSNGDMETLPKSGIGFKIRSKAIAFAKQYMKNN